MAVAVDDCDAGARVLRLRLRGGARRGRLRPHHGAHGRRRRRGRGRRVLMRLRGLRLLIQHFFLPAR